MLLTASHTNIKVAKTLNLNKTHLCCIVYPRGIIILQIYHATIKVNSILFWSNGPGDSLHRHY